MTPQERQAFLERFETFGEMQLHFCVLGGMFAEGIDFAANGSSARSSSASGCR